MVAYKLMNMLDYQLEHMHKDFIIYPLHRYQDYEYILLIQMDFSLHSISLDHIVHCYLQ